MTRPGRWVLAAAVFALAGATLAFARADVAPEKPTVTVYATPT